MASSHKSRPSIKGMSREWGRVNRDMPDGGAEITSIFPAQGNQAFPVIPESDSGNLIRKQAPWPGVDSALMLPPLRVTS